MSISGNRRSNRFGTSLSMSMDGAPSKKTEQNRRTLWSQISLHTFKRLTIGTLSKRLQKRQFDCALCIEDTKGFKRDFSPFHANTHCGCKLQMKVLNVNSFTHCHSRQIIQSFRGHMDWNTYTITEQSVPIINVIYIPMWYTFVRLGSHPMRSTDDRSSGYDGTW